jgi:hypothetical protein
MTRSSHLIITFPHRQCYFTLDDRFVHHFRRYELDEISRVLEESNLYPIVVKKVLGPLDKFTMMVTIGFVNLVRKFRSQNASSSEGWPWLNYFMPIFKWANRFYAVVIWLDAKIMPQKYSSVLLIKAEKRK